MELKLHGKVEVVTDRFKTKGAKGKILVASPILNTYLVRIEYDDEYFTEHLGIRMRCTDGVYWLSELNVLNEEIEQ